MCSTWLSETQNLFKLQQENPGVTEKACLEKRKEKKTTNKKNKTKKTRSKDNLDFQKEQSQGSRRWKEVSLKYGNHKWIQGHLKIRCVVTLDPRADIKAKETTRNEASGCGHKVVKQSKRKLGILEKVPWASGTSIVFLLCLYL